jgi:hypothetical protein
MNGNSFEKQETQKGKLKDLAERYTYAALFLLGEDLRLDPQSLLMILGGRQGISPALGKQINYLWQINFGTVYHPAPKSVLEIEIEEIEKSSVFYYKDSFVGKTDIYKDPIFWDILTQNISEEEYNKNNALLRVRNKIIPVLDELYKTLHVDRTEYMSVAPLFGPERRKNRTFELHIIDRETEEVQYALSYSKGELQVSEGNMPPVTANKIVYILRTEGTWE